MRKARNLHSADPIFGEKPGFHPGILVIMHEVTKVVYSLLIILRGGRLPASNCLRYPNGRQHVRTLPLVGMQEGDADVDSLGLLFDENHEVGWGESISDRGRSWVSDGDACSMLCDRS
jgi:hypothetical protein